jgi:hypothetical protein
MNSLKNGWNELSFADKLMIAKMGVDVAGGYMSPKEEDLIAKSKTWTGAFYGNTPEMAEKAVAAAPAATPATPATATAQPQRSLVAPPAQQAQAAGQPRQILPPQMKAASAPPAPRRLAELNPPEEGELFESRAPGVRYIA